MTCVDVSDQASLGYDLRTYVILSFSFKSSFSLTAEEVKSSSRIDLEFLKSIAFLETRRAARTSLLNLHFK